MTCGVYVIRNLWNGKVYVGSSMNIEERWKTHLCRLKGSKHPTTKLLRAWKKYGQTSFEFRIVEITSLSDLLSKEQYWIDTTAAFLRGYNTRPDARSCKGYKRGPQSEEHKRKNAEAHTGVRNANYGKARSEETKHKIASAQKGVARPSPSQDTIIKRTAAIKKTWDANPNKEKRITALAEARKNRVYHPHSEETKQKMRDAAAKRRSQF